MSGEVRVRRGGVRPSLVMAEVGALPWVDPAVADLTRFASERVAAGEVVGLGFVLVYADGGVSTAYTAGDRWSGLVAGAAVLTDRMMRDT